MCLVIRLSGAEMIVFLRFTKVFQPKVLPADLNPSQALAIFCLLITVYLILSVDKWSDICIPLGLGTISNYFVAYSK